MVFKNSMGMHLLACVYSCVEGAIPLKQFSLLTIVLVISGAVAAVGGVALGGVGGVVAGGVIGLAAAAIGHHLEGGHGKK